MTIIVIINPHGISELKAMDDFELVEYNPYTATEAERSEYKKVNPHGTVPALVTSEGDIMIEGAAICLYLAQLYEKLLPDLQHEAQYYK